MRLPMSLKALSTLATVASRHVPMLQHNESGDVAYKPQLGYIPDD